MAKNLTDQQEIFCHEIVKGKSQYEAYQVAYPKATKWKRNSVDANASQLMADTKIVQRIERLRAPIIRKTAYDVHAAHDEAERALALAMSTEQVGAAVAAIQLRAKLHGLLVERKEVKITKFDEIDADSKESVMEAVKLEMAKRAQARLAGPDQDVSDVIPK